MNDLLNKEEAVKKKVNSILIIIYFNRRKYNLSVKSKDWNMGGNVSRMDGDYGKKS